MIRSDRLLETFLMLCRINSFHPKEEEVMQVLRSRLADAGVEVTADEIGNLLVYWPGTGGRAGARLEEPAMARLAFALRLLRRDKPPSPNSYLELFRMMGQALPIRCFMTFPLYNSGLEAKLNSGFTVQYS